MWGKKKETKKKKPKRTEREREGEGGGKERSRDRAFWTLVKQACGTGEHTAMFPACIALGADWSVLFGLNCILFLSYQHQSSSPSLLFPSLSLSLALLTLAPCWAWMRKKKTQHTDEPSGSNTWKTLIRLKTTKKRKPLWEYSFCHLWCPASFIRGYWSRQPVFVCVCVCTHVTMCMFISLHHKGCTVSLRLAYMQKTFSCEQRQE